MYTNVNETGEGKRIKTKLKKKKQEKLVLIHCFWSLQIQSNTEGDLFVSIVSVVPLRGHIIH